MKSHLPICPFLVLVAIFSCNIAWGLPDDQISGGQDPLMASYTNKFLGTNYLAILRWNDIKDARKWNGDGPLPLSVTNAEVVASDALVRMFGRSFRSGKQLFNPSEGVDMKPWIAVEVILHRAAFGSMWYYEIRAQPYIDGSYNWPPVTVFVTMDGKASTIHKLP